jgi:hypothetical protein
MKLFARAALIVALSQASPAQACRLYSIWHYNFRQHCPVAVAMALAPQQPSRPPSAPPPVEIPLPSLEHMEFPPDSDDERLKGVGLLRLLLGTN